MGRMNQIKAYEHRAQYYETDQMGCVHHSNYIRWFEEARTDLLHQVGFSYQKMEELGVLSPVLSVTAEYKSMVRFHDVVEIYARITKFNGIKFTVSYQIIDQKTKELRTTGETTHCFLGRDYRPIRLLKEHKEVYDLFQELCETK